MVTRFICYSRGSWWQYLWWYPDSIVIHEDQGGSIPDGGYYIYRIWLDSIIIDENRGGSISNDNQTLFIVIHEEQDGSIPDGN